jgi:hypothetical protein
MASKQNRSFDPKLFLAKVGDGRSFGKYRKDEIVFSQGDPADAVFLYPERQGEGRRGFRTGEGSRRGNSRTGRFLRRGFGVSLPLPPRKRTRNEKPRHLPVAGLKSWVQCACSRPRRAGPRIEPIPVASNGQ